MFLFTGTIYARVFYVSPKGNDLNLGNRKRPFLTISKASDIAIAGDTIIVHAGVYRERIDPRNSGKSANERIVYMSAKNERVVIKGSEIVKGWIQVNEGVRKIELPDSFFGSYNPFKDNNWPTV
jgi:hypothetical protein